MFQSEDIKKLCKIVNKFPKQTYLLEIGDTWPHPLECQKLFSGTDLLSLLHLCNIQCTCRLELFTSFKISDSRLLFFSEIILYFRNFFIPSSTITINNQLIVSQTTSQ